MPTNRRTAEIGEEFYPTPPWATQALLDREMFQGHILEPACGDGAMAKVIMANGYSVTSSDLIDRGFGTQKDAFSYFGSFANVITNPPFAMAEDFFLHFHPLTRGKLCFFLRTAFLESARRYEKIFRQSPPTTVYVFSERVTMYPNGDMQKGTGTTSFSWFVWDNSVSCVNSASRIRWIEPGARAKMPVDRGVSIG